MEGVDAANATAVALSALNVAAVVWLLVRRHEPVVARRGYGLAAAGAAFAAVHAALMVAHESVGTILGPGEACQMIFWTSSLFIPFCLTTYILRCYHLFFQHGLTASKARYVGTHTSDFFIRHQWTDAPRTLWTFLAIYAVAWCATVAAMIYGATSSPFAGVGDNGDCLVGATAAAVAVQSVIGLAALLAFVILLWRVDDAFYIKWELRLVGWTTFVLSVAWAAAQWTTWPGSVLAATCLVVAMCEVFVLMSCLVPAVLSHRHIHASPTLTTELCTIARAQQAHSDAVMASVVGLDVSASSASLAGMDFSASVANVVPAMRSPSTMSLSTDLLRAVLVHPELLASFKQFAMRSWCVENLLFVVEVESFHAHAGRASMGMRACKLVQAFVAEGSPLQLNLLCTTQCDLLNRLAGGDISIDMFDAAVVEVEKQLRHDTLAKWRQTESSRIALARMNAA